MKVLLSTVALALVALPTAFALEPNVADPPHGSYFCPGENNSVYQASTGDNFKLLCSVDWVVDTKGRSGGKVRDLQAIQASSVRECVEQCAIQRSTGGNCSAISYGSDIGAALKRTGITGNCFLKDQRGAEDQADHSNQQEGAYLMDDDE